MELGEKVREVREGRQVRGINGESPHRGKEGSLTKDFKKVVRSVHPALVLQMIYFCELLYDPRVVSLKALGT